MKKRILYLTVSIVLAAILLFRLGVFYINVSAHNTYHLTERESALITDAILKFRNQVEREKFDEIAESLSKGRQAKYWEDIILKEIRENKSEYGNPLAWEIFRVAQPQVDAVKGETVYHVDCLTKFANEEIYENFIWSVKNDEVHLVHTDLHYPQATIWRVEARNRQKAVIEKYPGEIIIPYADRYIEIRY